MPLALPITDIEQLKSHPALARLLEWNASVVEAVKFDRDELTIWIEKDAIREVCAILRDSADCPFNYLCDLTCVDWYPSCLLYTSLVDGEAGIRVNNFVSLIN